MNRNSRTLLHQPLSALLGFYGVAGENTAAKLWTFALINRVASPSTKFPDVVGRARLLPSRECGEQRVARPLDNGQSLSHDQIGLQFAPFKHPNEEYHAYSSYIMRHFPYRIAIRPCIACR